MQESDVLRHACWPVLHYFLACWNDLKLCMQGSLEHEQKNVTGKYKACNKYLNIYTIASACTTTECVSCFNSPQSDKTPFVPYYSSI